MDETYFENINRIADSLRPMQAIADSLKPMQAIAASLAPYEQVYESARVVQETIANTVDMSSVVEAASVVSSSLEPIIETASAVAEIVEPVSSTIEIISETTEVVRRTFDLSGITAAIMSAVDLFAGVGELISETVTAMHERMHETMHKLWHWLVAHIKEFFEKREERKEHNLLLEVKQVIILCPNPCVKSLIIDFHEHTRLIRKTYLLRNQDRGSDDSSDNYCYNKVTLLTA